MSYEEHLGKSETLDDEITAGWLANACAVIGPDLAPEQPIPALWHWMLFQRWARANALREDGGARAEGFLPPFTHLPRRVAAGGRLRFGRPLRVGDHITRTSRIKNIADKDGKAGPMVLLTINRVITVAGEVAIDEEQDVIYLGPPSPSAAAAAAPSAPPLPAGAVKREHAAGPLEMFRYSAMTANSHRLHYDLEYATQVEGRAGLLVHGPLQATWLAGLAESLAPSKRLRSIEFRNLGSATHRDGMVAAAWPENDKLRLELRRADGERCIAGTAVLA
ncbi:MaoC family dehydratase N-terminal domain-containing protein [Ramlibacter sp. PS3R-8]|uniref:FAS1-like dehydratase domain-containing protein n=1 Tax=Ramlibacter sp. PS3R-8 TaxID=3133437 RepID=UPI00309D4CAB